MELAERVRTFVQPRGDERALDVGTGAGALAIALAPLVREITATDIVPELLEEARRRAPENMTVLEADATALPFADNSFDLVGHAAAPSTTWRAPSSPSRRWPASRFPAARS